MEYLHYIGYALCLVFGWLISNHRLREQRYMGKLRRKMKFDKSFEEWVKSRALIDLPEYFKEMLYNEYMESLGLSYKVSKIDYLDVL